MRYLHPMLLSQRVAHERLARICHGDYDREITLVSELQEPIEGKPRILGAARISKLHGMNEARFSVLISDCCHEQGIGTEMVRRVIDVARGERLQRITAEMTPDNLAMQHIFRELGFSLTPATDKKMVQADMKLS
jgi:acetyltransferase